MQKEFLALYHDELQTFRRRATSFSEKHPEAAAKLRLADGLADDPHVERLIESFAVTAARIRHKLEDSFPELSAGLLDALYPHLLAPQPSMSLVSLTPAPDLKTVQHVPRGFELLSGATNGDQCRFRTTQAVDLIPARIARIGYETNMHEASPSPFANARAALIIALAPLKRGGNFSTARLKTIRFHLSGAWEQASLLYMRLFTSGIGLKLSDAEGATDPLFLSKDHIQTAGFADEESLLPATANFNAGFRLLSEFFALKRKFLFFDISGFENWRGNAPVLTIYFDRQDLALKKQLSPESVTLNTTPVINLFRQRCEPVSLSNQREQYALVPDHRFRKTRKIHSIDQVYAVSGEEPAFICHPVYHAQTADSTCSLFWQLVRDPYADEDDDCRISFSGSALDTDKHFVTRIEALCTNGSLPGKLPYHAGNLQLLPAAPHSAIMSARCLMPFTPAVAQPLSGDQLWRFISHLRLSHISSGSDSGQSLRNILYLYRKGEDADGHKFIESIQNVSPCPSMCRVKQGGFAAATDFNIRFSANSLNPEEIFLFATVLNQFLSLYTSINSFSRVTAWLENLSTPVIRFPFHACARNAV